MMKRPRATIAAIGATIFALVGMVLLGGCSNEECAECGSCAAGTELTSDLLDARPAYTADAQPVVVLRLDAEGTCAGSGSETFVHYTEGGLLMSTDPVSFHERLVPESEPASSVYFYRTHMMSLDIRRTPDDVTLVFMGPETTFGLRCTSSDAVLDCQEL